MNLNPILKKVSKFWYIFFDILTFLFCDHFKVMQKVKKKIFAKIFFKIILNFPSPRFKLGTKDLIFIKKVLKKLFLKKSFEKKSEIL
jgi:hypothetical protein